MVSTFVAAHVTFLSVQTSLRDMGSRMPNVSLTPLISISQMQQRRQVWYLAPDTKSQYELEVRFSDAATRLACPAFTWALSSLALPDLQALLRCSVGLVPRTPEIGAPDASTQITQSFMYSAWQYLVNQTLADVLVPFTLAANCSVDVSISFNSLIMNADVSVERVGSTPPPRFGSWQPSYARSYSKPLLIRSQPFDTEVRLRALRVDAGTYQLRIKRTVFGSVPLGAPGSSLCLPFQFFFIAAPRTGTPYLMLDPPGGQRISPNEDVRIEFALSTRAYDRANNTYDAFRFCSVMLLVDEVRISLPTTAKQ